METLGKALRLLGVRDSGNPNTGQGERAFGAVVAVYGDLGAYGGNDMAVCRAVRFIGGNDGGTGGLVAFGAFDLSDKVVDFGQRVLLPREKAAAGCLGLHGKAFFWSV